MVVHCGLGNHGVISKRCIINNAIHRLAHVLIATENNAKEYQNVNSGLSMHSEHWRVYVDWPMVWVIPGMTDKDVDEMGK